MVGLARKIARGRGMEPAPTVDQSVRMLFDSFGRDIRGVAIPGAEIPRSDAELLAWYRDAAFRLVDYARKTKIFKVPDDYKLDVVETPEAYIVKAELPGITKDKIEVNVEDRDVTIGAEFLDAVDAGGKTLWKERTFSKASRSIRLPEAVDANAAQAKHVDGVLQLTLPKIAKANAKQITIQ